MGDEDCQAHIASQRYTTTASTSTTTSTTISSNRTNNSSSNQSNHQQPLRTHRQRTVAAGIARTAPPRTTGQKRQRLQQASVADIIRAPHHHQHHDIMCREQTMMTSSEKHSIPMDQTRLGSKRVRFDSASLLPTTTKAPPTGKEEGADLKVAATDAESHRSPTVIKISDKVVVHAYDDPMSVEDQWLSRQELGRIQIEAREMILMLRGQQPTLSLMMSMQQSSQPNTTTTSSSSRNCIAKGNTKHHDDNDDDDECLEDTTVPKSEQPVQDLQDQQRAHDNFRDVIQRLDAASYQKDNGKDQKASTSSAISSFELRRDLSMRVTASPALRGLERVMVPEVAYRRRHVRNKHLKVMRKLQQKFAKARLDTESRAAMLRVASESVTRGSRRFAKMMAIADMVAAKIDY